MHIVINGWFVGETTAGSGQYIDHLLAYLPRQATQSRISLLAPVGAGRVPSAAPWPGVEIVRLSLPSLPENLAKLWWEQVTVPRAARRLQADVLWIPYWAAPLWQPTPTVATVHDLIPALLPAYRGGRLQQLYTRLVSYTARRATAVITVSAASKRDLVEHLHIPAQRVHVVYHGPNVAKSLSENSPPADLSGFQNLTGLHPTSLFDNSDSNPPTTPVSASDPAAVRQKYNLPARFFLYLGGFDRRKNVRAIIHAYRRYVDRGGDPAVRLVIAGQLPVRDTPFAPDPKKIAAEAGLTDQVHFCGWVDEQDKPALYALATAYFFPSLYEGFGMMVLEAMAAGTPVVTSGTVDS